jgi:DNA (cytosine-5)-methyltransferase 1
VTIPPAWEITNKENNRARGLDDALHTVCTGGNLGLTFTGAVAALRDYRTVEQLVYGLDEPLTTQVAAAQHAVLSRSPYLVKYNRTGEAHGLGEELPTVTTRDRLGLVEPGEELDVEDCYFRMLQPHEIGAGMAFPADYRVLDNKRDRVKQYGNAVTPPVMEWLVAQAVASLS